jgi:hypothetical protein
MKFLVYEVPSMPAPKKVSPHCHHAPPASVAYNLPSALCFDTSITLLQKL